MNRRTRHALASIAAFCCGACGSTASPPGEATPPAGPERTGAVASELGTMIIPGDAGSCDPADLAWSPGSLPRLVLWLDAASVGKDGGPVTEWLDESPAHNHAFPSPASPTISGSAIGGLPAVHFDGALAGLQIPDAASLRWGTHDYGIFVVARFASTGPADQLLFQKSTASSPYDGPTLVVNSKKPTQNSWATSQISGGLFTTSQAGLDSSPHLFVARRVGTSLEIRIDGVLRGLQTVALVDGSAAGQPVSLGHGYSPASGAEALEGDIAEVVAVHGGMTVTDRKALECHLLLKYGL